MKTKKQYGAMLEFNDGKILCCKAERKGGVWMIGGDYDYSNVVMIMDLTDGKFYKWMNGRLKFQDNMGFEQMEKIKKEVYGE